MSFSCCVFDIKISKIKYIKSTNCLRIFGINFTFGIKDVVASLAELDAVYCLFIAMYKCMQLIHIEPIQSNAAVLH